MCVLYNILIFCCQVKIYKGGEKQNGPAGNVYGDQWRLAEWFPIPLVIPIYWVLSGGRLADLC
jgi:hypothetical protein